MINEKKFLNKETQEKITHRTKEEAQQELSEKFGIRNTSEFQLALQRGEIELAEAWLNYIVENKERFPQYLPTWNSWLNDRLKEIEIYKKLKKDGLLEKITPRTKEEAQQELFKKFGIRNTFDFRQALLSGKIKLAEAWLNYIVEHKYNFPQYLPTWNSWLRDRLEEIETYKKLKKEGLLEK